MGMYGRWHRLSPAKLEQAMDDLGWAYDLVQAERQAEEDSGKDRQLAELRSFGVDKTWYALHYLLERIGFPIDIVSGEHNMVEDPDADWGYGPPRFLNPQEVRTAAQALAGVTVDDLVRGLDPAELKRQGIDEELEFVADYLPEVVVWFDAAAAAGDAVLCWVE